MNPSFYPKHLARQYAQGQASGVKQPPNEVPMLLRLQNFERPWAQVYPLPGGETSQNPINNVNNKYMAQQQVVVDGQVQEEQTVGIEHRHVPNRCLSSSTCTTIVDATTKAKTDHEPINVVHKSSAVFSGLPPTFIDAMKKLFDLVDTHKQGRVLLEGINSIIKTSKQTLDKIKMPTALI